ncbi:DUF4123 domain-containing protein [Enterobacter bugandensis]|uniref:DUF4123 domain-containing protein n=1 Tax=Enterobacter bugandensis TaxID=881260 RepID=UPI00075081A1|nr:DUF4123 domain-containing protein [Enterobacter bugandensis]KUQ62800.1 hypothetical protein AWI22_06840 [Enterobacter bugandensis]
MEKSFWHLRDEDRRVLEQGTENAMICNALRDVSKRDDIPALPSGLEGMCWLEEQVKRAREHNLFTRGGFPRMLAISLIGGSHFWLQEDVQALLSQGAPGPEKLTILEELALLNPCSLNPRASVKTDVTQNTIYRLCEAGLPLWVIVDNALDASVQGMADALEVASYSLFRADEQALAFKGPWLLAAWTKPRLVQYILSRPEYGFNALWLVADVDEPEQLIRHLQGLLYIKEEGGASSRFRFYDPRVFNHWLQNLASVRLADFFGPVQMWISPDPNLLMTAQRAWQYKWVDGQMNSSKIPLQQRVNNE